MAQQTSYTPTPSQWASAAMHLDRSSDWRYYWYSGVRYVAIPSGRSSHVYRLTADATFCDCEWTRRGYPLCSHKLALELAALEDELRAVAEREAVYDQLYAEVMAEPVAELPDTVAWRHGLGAYAEIFPACASGCGDRVERKGERCYQCESNETRRLEIASKRACIETARGELAIAF